MKSTFYMKLKTMNDLQGCAPLRLKPTILGTTTSNGERSISQPRLKQKIIPINVKECVQKATPSIEPLSKQNVLTSITTTSDLPRPYKNT